jgi:hypothetical protein
MEYIYKLYIRNYNLIIILQKNLRINYKIMLELLNFYIANANNKYFICLSQNNCLKIMFNSKGLSRIIFNQKGPTSL